MLESGYIKLHRSIVKWEWWGNRNTRDLFIYLLLIANISDSRFESHVIKRGSLVCSLPTLSAGSGLTIQEVRTALNHLKSTGELIVQKTPKFSIITINNYDKFQNVTDNLTVNQQSINSQLTVNQHYNKKNKEDKEDKEEYIYIISLFNNLCKSLPKIQKLTETRKRAIKSAEKQLNGDFENFFKKVEQSDFLTGRNGVWNGCCFDWILKPQNLIKIIEGNYNNRSDENGSTEKLDKKQDTEHKYGDWL